MVGKIEISIIPHDLRHEETISHIADTLDSLNEAVTHIFDSVNNRIRDNTQRLNNIQNRATKLQNKIEYIQTNLSLKAVKMCSVAKYPASHTYKEYEMTIKPIQREKTNIVKAYKTSVPIEDKFDATSTSNSQSKGKQYASVNLQEKLQFYHLKTKSEGKQRKKTVNRVVSSVSALLPFDSVKGHYEPASFIAADKKDERYQIEDAPDSILQPWHSSEVETPSGYMYAPALGEVPQIDVPLILPDLPGIVDDERFSIDLPNPIAPSSAAVTPTLKVDLPTLIPSSEQKQVPTEVPTPNLPELREKEPVEPKIEAAPAPPPPPPPPPIFDVTEKQAVAPPAPPPPPPAELENKVEKKNVVKPAKPDVGDDRNNLMAEIRNAGGFGKAKLKPALAEMDKDDRWASASVGGDLMADLHAKLLQRRKNIIGISSETFKRMSSMIPPPPKPNDPTEGNSATSECDSQPDADEWDE